MEKMGGFDILGRNSQNMRVMLSGIGASVSKILLCKKDGQWLNVSLGFDDEESYKSNYVYLGATVGRYAGRIKNGHFKYNGIENILDKNDGNSCLHGGSDCFAFRRWDLTADGRGIGGDEIVRYSLDSKDGDQGMAGSVGIDSIYTLKEDNVLMMSYEAYNASMDLPLNLTNHTYFNLNGAGEGDILEHELWLDSDYICEMDDEFTATGNKIAVEGTPFDFRKPKLLGRDIKEKCKSLELARGYDHTYILKKNRPDWTKPIAKVVSKKSHIAMEVYTTRACLHLYTGNFLGDYKGPLKKFMQYGGFCLEAEDMPNAMNYKNADETPVVKKAADGKDPQNMGITCFRFIWL